MPMETTDGRQKKDCITACGEDGGENLMSIYYFYFCFLLSAHMLSFYFLYVWIM